MNDATSIHRDGEILERAAKAAGISPDLIGFGPDGEAIAFFVDREPWRPFSDDGDALRLAIRLEICIKFTSCVEDSPLVCAGSSIDTEDHWVWLSRAPNFAAATRKAIVVAAASLAEKHTPLEG